MMMLNLYPLIPPQPPPTPLLEYHPPLQILCMHRFEHKYGNIWKKFCFFPIYNNKEKIIFEHPQVVIRDDLVWIVDLGSDSIYTYR